MDGATTVVVPALSAQAGDPLRCAGCSKLLEREAHTLATAESLSDLVCEMCDDCAVAHRCKRQRLEALECCSADAEAEPERCLADSFESPDAESEHLEKVDLQRRAESS
eukprot:TRINITY_DN15959_c0_g1_i1.p3 TRINITY_DN15959_c0_g1~~TRINITY_DN15959_c0_g1_i1.p3  ORF type:complete len:109 (-),score=32.53 TRINITY_DN15959_c0_g1_i1:172-498(-)